jgi:hypothetical protein
MPTVTRFYERLDHLIDVADDAPFSPETELHIQMVHDSVRREFEVVIMNPLRQRTIMEICHAICKPENRSASRSAIENDWNMPDDPNQAARLAAHQKGLKEAWKIFMEHRMRFLQLMEMSEPSAHEGADIPFRILPIARWEHDLKNKTSDWNLQNPGRMKRKQLVDHFMPEHSKKDPNSCDSLAGFLSVAALSPEISQSDSMAPKMPHTEGGEKFPMGPAQIPVLAIQRRKNFLASNLIQAIERKMEAHL